MNNNYNSNNNNGQDPFQNQNQNGYGSQMPYQNQPPYGSQYPYQSQNTYGSQDPYQSQNTYGSQDSYQSQNTYGSQDPYQSQNTYGSQDPYQSQNTYGSQDPYQSQNPYGSQTPYTQYPVAGSPAMNTASAVESGAGILKAIGCGILGGIIGGGMWFGFSFAGRLVFIAGVIAGFVGVMGASSASSDKRGLKILLGIIFSLGLFAVGVYLGFGVDIYTALEGEYDLGRCISSIPDFLSEPSLISGFMTDAGIGLLTYAAGVAGGIVKVVKGK